MARCRIDTDSCMPCIAESIIVDTTTNEPGHVPYHSSDIITESIGIYLKSVITKSQKTLSK